MNLNEQMSTKQSIIFVIVITISLFIVQQVVYGQTLDDQRETLYELVNYCYEHADRPNPIQDLIDKGFLSSNFTGETCISVKQMYNEVETRISKQLANLSEERGEREQRNMQYIECARKETSTYEECSRILNGTK